MYRIGEIAKKCGVSSQAVNQYLQSKGLKDKAIKEGRAILIPDEIAQEVINHYSPIYNEVVNETTTNNNEVVNTLTKQLEILQTQIDIKDEQIRALNKTVEALVDTNKALSASNAIRDFTDKKELLLGDNPTQEKLTNWQRIKEILKE